MAAPKSAERPIILNAIAEKLKRELWSLNRLSRQRPRRLMGVFEFGLPCGRCQSYIGVHSGRYDLWCSDGSYALA